MNNVREILSRLWLQALDGSAMGQVEDQEKFFESGGNSLAAITLYMETEERFALKIDPTEFLSILAEGGFGDLVRLAEVAEKSRA